MVGQAQKPSGILLYSILAFIGLLMMGLLYIFIFSVENLSAKIKAFSPFFIFHVGAFYLPGFEVGFALLIFVIIYTLALGKKFNNKVAVWCTGIGVFAIVLIYALP